MQNEEVIFLRVQTSLNYTDQRPYWFAKAKDDFCIKIEFNSRRNGMVHQYGGRFFVLEHQYGCRDVMRKRALDFLQCLIKLGSHAMLLALS